MVNLQMHFPKYEDFTLNNKISLSFSVRCSLWHFLFIVVCGILCSLWFLALSAVSSLLCNQCYYCYKTRVKAAHYDTGAWWNVWGKGNMWCKIILSRGNKCTLLFYIMTPSSLEKNLLYCFQISLTKYKIL